MTRPLTSAELSAEKRHVWYAKEEREARESRGEKGQMEFWLRITRSRIAKEIKAGRSDALAGFALVLRLFMTAIDKRAAGDRRLWDDLLRYAHQVVDRTPARD